MVAELVPEVDRFEVSDEIPANRVAADVELEVDELFTVDMAVEDNKGGPTNKIVLVVGPFTIVVAELFANRVAADVVRAVVEVAVEHDKAG